MALDYASFITEKHAEIHAQAEGRCKLVALTARLAQEHASLLQQEQEAIAPGTTLYEQFAYEYVAGALRRLDEIVNPVGHRCPFSTLPSPSDWSMQVRLGFTTYAGKEPAFEEVLTLDGERVHAEYCAALGIERTGRAYPLSKVIHAFMTFGQNPESKVLA